MAGSSALELRAAGNENLGGVYGRDGAHVGPATSGRAQNDKLRPKKSGQDGVSEGCDLHTCPYDTESLRYSRPVLTQGSVSFSAVSARGSYCGLCV